MATLQKIRSKGPLLLIIVGLALFAFIAEELFRSIQTATNESKQRVGEIYGKTVSYHEFQALVDEYTEVVKFTSGMTSLNDEQMTQLRDQVWNTLVNNKLVEHEAEQLGLTVTDTEVQAIISQGTNPLLMQTPFRNEKTGMFDVNLLKKFLTDYEGMKSQTAQVSPEYIEYYQSLFSFWTFVEKSIRQEALNQKYQALLAKSIISNPISAKASFEGRTNESDIMVVAVPYTSIADNTIKVEDADLKAKYNEMKEMFMQYSESRDVKYIDIAVTASKADKDSLDKEMNEYYNNLINGGDIAKIVRESASTVAYSKLPVTKGALPTDIAAGLDSMSIGSTKAPYYNPGDNTMNIVKLLNKVSAPDSIEFRQIQVAGADVNLAKKTADSILIAIQNGADFETIAKKYNQEGTKSWVTSKNYEGSTLDGDNLQFIETLTGMSSNSVQKIDFAQGHIILQVTDRRAMVDKYDVVVIKRVVDFSKDTYTKAYNDFSHFLASNPTLKEIETNALKEGYNLQERKNMFNYEHYVGGVRGTHEALKWVFNEDTEVNSVSSLYECGNNDHMMIVALTGIHEKGYRPMDDVKDILTAEVIKDKKAAQIKEKLANVKSIAEAQKTSGAVSDTVKHITFSSPAFITCTGSSEPALSGCVAKTAQGKFAGPVKGNAAVYAFQVLAKNKLAETFNKQGEEQQQIATYMRAMGRFINELYQKANIEDNRYLFY